MIGEIRDYSMFPSVKQQSWLMYIFPIVLNYTEELSTLTTPLK